MIPAPICQESPHDLPQASNTPYRGELGGHFQDGDFAAMLETLDCTSQPSRDSKSTQPSSAVCFVHTQATSTDNKVERATDRHPDCCGLGAFVTLRSSNRSSSMLGNH